MECYAGMFCALTQDDLGEYQEVKSNEDKQWRFVCLYDELETSRELLKSGFCHLQRINIGRACYHLPHQLLASGLERLMKCYIAAVIKGRDGVYPDRKAMQSLGHDLENLLTTICTDHFGGTHRPLLKRDLEFISSDSLLNECVRILSLFGRKGRYYNLDVVSGADLEQIDPVAEWKKMEIQTVDPIPYLNDLTTLCRDYYQHVNRLLIGRIERLVRAIAMQFTLGGHADSGGELRSLSNSYTEFRNLLDNDLDTSTTVFL